MMSNFHNGYGYIMLKLSKDIRILFRTYMFIMSTGFYFAFHAVVFRNTFNCFANKRILTIKQF